MEQISLTPGLGTPEEAQKDFHKQVLVFLGIIVLFAVGLGGVFLGKYFYAPKTSQPALSGTPTPRAEALTPTSTPDPTEEWKTYTNSTYRFSFEYPSAWMLNDIVNNNEDMLVVDLAGEGFSSPDQYQANNLLVRVLSYQKQPTEKICFPRKSSPECYSISQAQTTTVSGTSGYLIDYFIPEPGGISKTTKIRLILVENHGYIYSISQQRIVSRENDFLSIFDQILSTFKFLN